MNIADDCVVTLAYTLRDDAGEVLDSATAGDPFAFVHGRHSVIPGLEKALTGRAAGDTLDLTIAPADAYGERSPARVQVVPRDRFPADIDIEPGMQFHASDEHGGRMAVRVTEVNEDGVVVDANHPLAGQTLHFAVQVLGVRAATAEELAHGHVHGAGGHHH
ncbi:FKBP-type peptidyl-prolyl cis-trans isomerase [Immundisolibacter sp.]